jgi:outer membrane protein
VRLLTKVTALAALAALALAASMGQGQPAAPALPEGTDLSKPLSLVQCVQIALAVNPQLSMAQNGVRQATAAVTQARSARLPNLSFDGSAGASRQRGGSGGGGGAPTGSPSSTSWGTDLVLSQTLYQSGLSEGIRSARASAQASRLGLDDTRRIVILDVAQSYYAALAATALVDVAGRTLENAARHVDMATARITAGTVAQSDLYPFQVEMAQARLSAIAAENQAQTSLTALKEAIGLPAGTQLQLADELGRPPLTGTLPDLLQTAYRDRPDVRRQQALIEAARLTARVAEIDRGPVLDVSGGATYGTGSGATGTDAQVQAGVTFPVFDGGYTKARAQSARAALDSSRQALQQLQIAVGAEVESSHLNAAEASNRIDAAEAALRAAQVSLDVAEQRYGTEVGIGTFIEVTDAQVNLRQAEVDRVQALYDYNTALAALRAAIGQAAVEGVQ